MKDIEYDEKAGRGIACSALNGTQTIVNGTETRLISTTNTGWMLGTGWILFAFSQILNFIFYKMHPSSPEMWTWGKVEELKEWTPPGERENDRSGQSEASNIELPELLPPGSNGDLQNDDVDDFNDTDL